MSYARLLATGSGKLAFRISIDGIQYQPVTSAAMEKTTAGGNVRKVGLRREGIRDEWESQLEQGTVKASGFTATIADYNDVWLGQFAARPRNIAYLKSTVSKTATGWNVTDSTNFAVDSWAYVGHETVKITAKPSATQMTVSRGAWTSTAVKYWVDTSTDGSLYTTKTRITDKPERFEGRRVRLYAYGEGDDPQGDGTQVWLGVVETEPRMSGQAEWQIQFGAITRKLEQYLGADLGASMKPRGIRRLSPLVGKIRRWTSAPNGLTLPTGYEEVNFSLDGPDYWETQELFCRDLTAAMMASATTMTSWTTPSVRAVPIGESDYEIHWTSNGGYISVHTEDPIDKIDGFLGGDPSIARAVFGVTSGTAISPNVAQTSGNTYRAMSEAELNLSRAVLPGVRSVPRGVSFSDADFVGGTVATGYTRVYLGGDQEIAAAGDNTLALITIPSTEGLEARSIAARVTDSDATDRWIEISSSEPMTFTAANAPDIKITRYYGRICDVGQLMYNLATSSQDNVGLGAYPDITNYDIDDFTWAAGGRLGLAWHPVLASRNFFASNPIRLDKVLAEELKAAGLMMVPKASGGTVSVQMIRMPALLNPDLIEITDAHINLRAGYPEWEPSRFGTLHTVTFKASYDPIKEQHYKPTYMIVDEAARVANPLGQRLAIELYSEWANMFTTENGQRVQTLLSESELTLLFSDTLGMFGQPYQIIRVPCTMVHAETNIGDQVALTCAHIPDWQTGSRGVSQLPALVVGRRREWDRGVVWLTLMAKGAGRVGYAPSFTVIGVSGSGTLRTFTLADFITNPLDFSSLTLNENASVNAYYSIGDRVVYWTWNTGTPAEQAGTITAVTASTMTVQLDGAFTATSGLACISFADADDATGISSTQQLYCYIADTTNRIDVDGTYIDARVYS